MNNNNHENDSKVKIISEYFVKPNCEVQQSKNPYYLSAKDLFQLSLRYMHKGLLYAKPSSLSTDDDVYSLVDKLRHSMSIALVDFYPLAGRLETIDNKDDNTSLVYVDCNKGPGAKLVHATAKVTVCDIVSSYKNISRSIWSFFVESDPNVVNHDGHTIPLMSVQVTDLVDGVFIGFTMNHSLGDGTSFWQFVKALSKIFMGQEADIEKPIFKSVLQDGYGPVIKLPHRDPNEFKGHRDMDPRLTLRAFHFTSSSVARLKALASDTTTTNNNIKISSFQALSAFVWLSLARARNLPLEWDTGCCLIANIRPRHDPPLAPTHFGNLVNPVMAICKVKELTENGLGWTAMRVHQAIMGLDDKVVMASLKAYVETPIMVQYTNFISRFATNPPLFFVGSMRFDAYGSEFGLGKAIATRPGHSIWYNGLILVDPGREGGGSVDLKVCQLSETITALESDDEFMCYVS